MNEKAMWELAEFLKKTVDSTSDKSAMPGWIAGLADMPIDAVAQDICRAMRIGLFAGEPTIVDDGKPAPTVWVDPLKRSGAPALACRTVPAGGPAQ